MARRPRPVDLTLPYAYTPPPWGSYVDASHEYRIAGVLVPSVTQVLNEEGFIDFSAVPRHRLIEAQARGIRVHQAIHYFLEHDLMMDSVWDEDRGYVASAVDYLAATGRKPLRDVTGRIIGVEFRFWNPRYLFGGGCDFLGFDLDAVLAVDDFKSGEPDDVAAPLQTAAYENAVREVLLAPLPKGHRLKGQPIRRRAVKLFKDGRTARVEPYDDPRDWPQFLNALSCTHFRRNGMKHDTPATRELRRLAHGYV